MMWWILLSWVFFAILKEDRGEKDIPIWEYVLGYLLGPLFLAGEIGKFLQKKGVHIEAGDP